MSIMNMFNINNIRDGEYEPQYTTVASIFYNNNDGRPQFVQLDDAQSQDDQFYDGMNQFATIAQRVQTVYDRTFDNDISFEEWVLDEQTSSQGHADVVYYFDNTLSLITDFIVIHCRMEYLQRLLELVDQYQVVRLHLKNTWCFEQSRDENLQVAPAFGIQDTFEETRLFTINAHCITVAYLRGWFDGVRAMVQHNLLTPTSFMSMLTIAPDRVVDNTHIIRIATDLNWLQQQSNRFHYEIYACSIVVGAFHAATYLFEHNTTSSHLQIDLFVIVPNNRQYGWDLFLRFAENIVVSCNLIAGQNGSYTSSTAFNQYKEQVNRQTQSFQQQVTPYLYNLIKSTFRSIYVGCQCRTTAAIILQQLYNITTHNHQINNEAMIYFDLKDTHNRLVITLRG